MIKFIHKNILNPSFTSAEHLQEFKGMWFSMRLFDIKWSIPSLYFLKELFLFKKS